MIGSGRSFWGRILSWPQPNLQINWPVIALGEERKNTFLIIISATINFIFLTHGNIRSHFAKFIKQNLINEILPGFTSLRRHAENQAQICIHGGVKEVWAGINLLPRAFSSLLGYRNGNWSKAENALALQIFWVYFASHKNASEAQLTMK